MKSRRVRRVHHMMNVRPMRIGGRLDDEPRHSAQGKGMGGAPCGERRESTSIHTRGDHDSASANGSASRVEPDDPSILSHETGDLALHIHLPAQGLKSPHEELSRARSVEPAIGWSKQPLRPPPQIECRAQGSASP